MRYLKIAIIAGFIAFTAACYLFSGANLSVKFDSADKTAPESFFQHAVTVKSANPQSVKGDFERENILFYNHVKVEMSRTGDGFFVKFTNGAEISDYKIEAVVGAEKLQQYIAQKDGKAILLPVAYDLRKKRWLSANEIVFEAADADFFKYQADWQTACAACHLEKLDETQVSFDVKKLDSAQVLLACGSCHAKGLHESFLKLEEIAVREKYFDDLISAHRNAPPSAEDFFADGSPNKAAHEYQGILRSVCFVKNKGGEVINCLSCHSPENGLRDVKTDEKLLSGQACTSCHQEFTAPETVVEHTKHRTNSEANCYGCHLPEIAYGHLEFQRTHEISVPNPSLTVEKQVPNACNLCHADKSVNWAITQSKKLWSERFRDAKVSDDDQFNQPEGVRGLFANDALTRALTANALKRQTSTDWFAPLADESWRNEKYPLVQYFLANTLTTDLSGIYETDSNFLP